MKCARKPKNIHNNIEITDISLKLNIVNLPYAQYSHFALPAQISGPRYSFHSLKYHIINNPKYTCIQTNQCWSDINFFWYHLDICNEDFTILLYRTVMNV